MLQLESAQKDKIIVKFSQSKNTQTFLKSFTLQHPKFGKRTLDQAKYQGSL